MSKVQNVCECSADEGLAAMMQISSEEKECCKINISEITNSNTLDKNKTKILSYLSYQSVNYLVPVIDITKTYVDRKILANNIPVPDIPIRNSSLLI
jgi:hypothetical protein